MPRLPPPPLRMAIEAGLRGAVILGRGQPHGLMLIEDTAAGIGRSFWAAAICLPAFLALRLLSWSETEGPGANLPYSLLVELIGYAGAWAGFALAALPVARAMGREAQWPHFVAAWNWANVVQYVVVLAIALPAALGLPAIIGNGLGLAALGYAVWLEWFVARTALRLRGSQAAGFVVIDLAIGLFVGGMVARLTGG